MRIAVLASGRGSNLGALIDAQRGGNLPVHIVGVFSDKPSAPALALARESNIPTAHLDPRDFAQRLAFDLAAFATIAKWKPELIVLAGFMRILDPRAFEPWLGRIINIHPSLLPKYPGLHTHRRVLAAGDRQHGASVHFVTAELDGGPVLAQVMVDVRRGDTEQGLAERLLPREHALIVACVDQLARNRLYWSNEGIRMDGQPLACPLVLADDGTLETRA